MNKKNTIIFTFFLCVIPLLSMNHDNTLNMIDKDNELQLIKPNDYIIAIHYPKPEEIQNDVNYTAIGILDPEEVEKVSEYKWCPSPYNNLEYNKTRRNMSLISGILSCCIVGCKTWLMYNKWIANQCCTDHRNQECSATYTCQEVWWPMPCIKEFDTFCVTGIERGQESGTMGMPGTCTIFFIASSLCALYAWMPCHNKDGCLPYKKVVRKVFRRKRDNTENI